MTDQHDNSGLALSSTDDLKARLRQRDRNKRGYYGNPLYNRDGLEAADRIGQLERRIYLWMQKVGTLQSRAARLSDALTKSQAEVAAAYERAAREAQVESQSNNPYVSGLAVRISDRIRALATTDQTAALDTIRAEAREQGMREAAEIAYEVAHNTNDISKIREAILDAITKGAKA